MVSKEKSRIRHWDWLLIIGLSLAPMTGLRIWKIGPAELLCFIWGLRFFPKRIIRLNIISKFFIAFLGSMFIGTFIGRIVAPNELVMGDWFTWLFLAFIALAIYDGIINNDLDYNEALLNYFCFIAASWYIVLYFYSLYVSRSFLGAPLWYRGVRYTGGARNPHQVAVLMCGITFCFIRNIIKKRLIIPSIIGVIAAIFVEFQTASSTGIASIFFGILATVMILTFYNLNTTSAKISVLTLEMIVGVVITAVAYPVLYRYFYIWLSNDANGLGRLDLFAQIGATLRKSPLFGLGPGVHALWRTDAKEFHNTYLEIIAATGLIGFISFMVLTIRSIKTLLSDATLIPVMVAIYGYGLAGFAMRRLAYWGIFIFILVIAEQSMFRATNIKMGTIQGD